MARPLRILVFGAVDGTHRGGVQTVIGALVTGLRRTGHHVHAAWSAPTDRPVADIAPWRLHVRTGAQPGQIPKRRTHLPSLFLALRKLARIRPDIVHVHFITSATYYFLLLRRVFRFRLILTAHGSDLLQPLPESAPYLPDFLHRADAITVVSADLRDRVRALAGVPDARVHLIPNSVDTDFWSPAETGDRTARTVVAIGRLEPVKGFDILQHAFAQVVKTVPDAQLVLIGDGNDRQALADQADALGIAPHVTFAGGMDRAAVRTALRNAAVYALSSRSEGMPLALIEAMACRLPCVVTRVGGVAEIVGDSAVLVPPEGPAQLAEAIIALLTDPAAARDLAAAARQRSLAFSSRTAVTEYEKVYRSVVSA